jgi:lipid-binding SYLF domain-containing protein
MKSVIGPAAAILLMAAGTASADEAQRLTAAANAVTEIRNEIPQDYWNRARCVVVIPELKKAAFIFGGEYGKGVMSCRAGDQWSAPVFMQLAKGSWGFQAGVEQADVVLLVMNESGAQKLLQNKVNLGADASVAAGPLGRRQGVSTDAAITAEILAYSRSKGLFAGINLSGGVLRPDDDANKATYGANATPATILAMREMSAPPEAAPFLAALKGASAAPPKPNASAAPPAATRPTTTPTTDEDLRARVVDLQQSVDRMLADTTPAAVGTSGAVGSSDSGTIAVDRARLMQLRQQIDAVIATLNRR